VKAGGAPLVEWLPANTPSELIVSAWLNTLAVVHEVPLEEYASVHWSPARVRRSRLAAPAATAMSSCLVAPVEVTVAAYRRSSVPMCCSE
jgi:hypothetical protein